MCEKATDKISQNTPPPYSSPPLKGEETKWGNPSLKGRVNNNNSRFI